MDSSQTWSPPGMLEKQDRYKEFLLGHLSYDGASGKFYWSVNYRRCRAGQEKSVGIKTKPRHSSRGVLSFEFSGKKVSFEPGRVAWLLHTGEWPVGQIDHKNRNPLDQRIENLRDVPVKVNAQNKAGSSNGSQQRKDTHRVRIVIHDKRYTIGSWPTKEMADRVYLAMKREFQEGCSHWDAEADAGVSPITHSR